MGRTIDDIHAAMKREEALPVSDVLTYLLHHGREAIIVEREACALIADAAKGKAWNGGEYEVCERIAAMIRGRGAGPRSS